MRGVFVFGVAQIICRRGGETPPLRLAAAPRSTSPASRWRTAEMATPATAFTGPGRHHGCPPVRPSSFGPDQGHARSTPSGEAEPGASWFGVRTTLGLASHFHASARLRPRSCPFPSPLGDSSGLGSRQSVMSSLAGRVIASGARCSPCSAPVQSGLPVGTFSCSTRDGLLSERSQALTNDRAGEWLQPVETVDRPVDKQ